MTVSFGSNFKASAFSAELTSAMTGQVTNSFFCKASALFKTIESLNSSSVANKTIDLASLGLMISRSLASLGSPVLQITFVVEFSGISRSKYSSIKTLSRIESTTTLASLRLLFASESSLMAVNNLFDQPKKTE